MTSSRQKGAMQNLLSLAGVAINGQNPWDMRVHDERLYSRVLAYGSLGAGEAYMDGWWDAQQLDEFFSRVLKAELDTKIVRNFRLAMTALKTRLLNPQRRSKAFAIGEAHYDIGNNLYEAMLDKRLTYTCGYWTRGVENLNDAQEAKLDLTCRKLGLKSGQRVLDIGCGWGSFLKFAVEHYGIAGVGVTVSKEQVMLAKQLCKGLPVEIRLQDYRDVHEQFDHIVSLGMFEHVGWRNYRAYMEVVRRALKDNGLFLLHTIGNNRSVYGNDPWMEKYIFPNSVVPSLTQIAHAMEGLFVMEDWHNFSADYDKTLMAWCKNFNTAWPQLKARYGDRFYRMWKYYLLASAGAFRSRVSQLWQIVLSKHGVPGGYRSIR